MCGNDVQLGQLFQDLVGNALKYRNGIVPIVHIGSEPRDGEWLVSGNDNGIGFEPKVDEKVFVIL